MFPLLSQFGITINFINYSLREGCVNMEKNKRIHIGTSGWDYKHWVSVFYPENTREKDFFKFYSTKFKTAEINSSFYHLPSEKTVEKWKEAAPHGFLYAVRFGRYNGPRSFSASSQLAFQRREIGKIPENPS
jgi:hypothetical protein